MNFFVTGTDTDVGKTYCLALLTRALRRAGYGSIALKPICCGPRDDVHALHAASEGALDEDTLNPLWLREAAAPLVAARAEKKIVDLAALTAWFESLRSAHPSLLVEGAGGWLVPLTASTTVADLAVQLRLPVLLVVANRLGCLNHALLTLESIRARGLTCAGLILNHLSTEDSIATRTNRDLLAELSGVPILFEVHAGQTELSPAALATLGA